MQKSLLFIFFLFGLAFPAHAQRDGFVVFGDSALVQGKLNFNPNSGYIVDFSTDGINFDSFTAKQISELGFNTGGKYLARRVPIDGRMRWVFLREVEADYPKILQLEGRKKRIFIEGDSLQALLPEEYQNWLYAQLGDRVAKEPDLSHVAYHGQVVAQILHGDGKSPIRSYPDQALGVLVDVRSITLDCSAVARTDITQGEIEDINTYLLTGTSVYIGGYYQYPIPTAPSITLSPQVSLGRSTMGQEYDQEIRELQAWTMNAAMDFQANLFSLSRFAPFALIGLGFEVPLQSRLAVSNIVRTNRPRIDRDNFLKAGVPYTTGTFGLGVHALFIPNHPIVLQYRRSIGASVGNAFLLNTNTLSVRFQL